MCLSGYKTVLDITREGLPYDICTSMGNLTFSISNVTLTVRESDSFMTEAQVSGLRAEPLTSVLLFLRL